MPGSQGPREDGVGRAEGRGGGGDGDRDSRTVEKGAVVPEGLASSLTLFLELSCKAGKDILLQAQHPKHLLHEKLTWEGAG